MKKIIVFSRCLKLNTHWAQFHFKGHYQGHKVNLLHFSFEEESTKVEKGGNYLMDVEVGEVDQSGVLKGRIRKLRKIGD